jgi:hypothetical protein
MTLGLERGGRHPLIPSRSRLPRAPFTRTATKKIVSPKTKLFWLKISSWFAKFVLPFE